MIMNRLSGRIVWEWQYELVIKIEKYLNLREQLLKPLRLVKEIDGVVLASIVVRGSACIDVPSHRLLPSFHVWKTRSHSLFFC